MTEEALHRQICNYLKLQYKNIIFTTDMSGIKLSIGQARKYAKLRSNRGIPDILIFASRNGYSGLMLEVKKESPFRKDGKLKKNEHLQEQNELHERLRKENYIASFVWTFRMAKALIDAYLSESYKL